MDEMRERITRGDINVERFEAIKVNRHDVVVMFN